MIGFRVLATAVVGSVQLDRKLRIESRKTQVGKRALGGSVSLADLRSEISISREVAFLMRSGVPLDQAGTAMMAGTRIFVFHR